MSISLDDLLELVGELDDKQGAGTARERFRTYLVRNVVEIGLLRDYVEACLRNSGPQYKRAFQDLVNRLGELLGFQVEYGRYTGTAGEIGFDGLWRSPSGEHCVIVEVKTTDVYAVKTSTLLNYINELISAGRVPQASRRIGLYVVGRRDAGFAHLENAILAEKRVLELRLASVDSLLSLAELAMDYEVDHNSIVGVLFPSGPRVDPIIDLMARLVAQVNGNHNGDNGGRPGPRYYLTPVCWKGWSSPMEAVGRLLTANKYAIGERTPCRQEIAPGDWLCFYASGFGVFAHAKVASSPKYAPLPDLQNNPELYPWTFDLAQVTVYEDDPVPLAREVRGQLDAFADTDLSKNWGWFVTALRKLTQHDFELLTRRR